MLKALGRFQSVPVNASGTSGRGRVWCRSVLKLAARVRQLQVGKLVPAMRRDLGS